MLEFNLDMKEFAMSSDFHKLKEKGDAGIYVFHYIYRFLTERRITDVIFQEKEKRVFLNKVEWLSISNFNLP